MARHWWLISDIDGTLTGDPDALQELSGQLALSGTIGFGVASGRSPELVEAAVREFALPEPELIIAAVGSEVKGAGLREADWPGALLADWQPEALDGLLSGVPGVERQPPAGQGRHKLGYYASAEAAVRARAELEAAGLKANLLHSADRFLDVLPAGVSKGSAVRFAAAQLGVPLSRVVVAGDTGNDRDMLLSGARAILVANFTRELDDLVGHADVYRARAAHAAGILEGLRHYGVIPG